MTNVIDCPRCGGRLVLRDVIASSYGRTWTFEEGFCDDCGRHLSQVTPSQLKEYIRLSEDDELARSKAASRALYQPDEGEPGPYHVRVVPDDGSPTILMTFGNYHGAHDYFMSIRDDTEHPGEVRIVSCHGKVYYDGPYGKEAW